MVIFRHPSMGPSTINTLLAALAGSDTLVLIFSVIYFSVEGDMVQGVLALLFSISRHCTLLLSLFVGLWRFFAITKALKAKGYCTPHNTRRAIVASVTVAVAFGIPQAVWQFGQQLDTETRDDLEKSFLWLNALVVLVFFVILTCLTIAMIISLVRSAWKKREMTQDASHKNEIKTTTMLLMVMILTIAFYSPYMVSNFILLASEVAVCRQPYITILILVNSLNNFFIFLFMSSNFQQILKLYCCQIVEAARCHICCHMFRRNTCCCPTQPHGQSTNEIALEDL